MMQTRRLICLLPIFEAKIARPATRAVLKLKDRDELLAFYDFPAQGFWQSIRTSYTRLNPPLPPSATGPKDPKVELTLCNGMLHMMSQFT